MCWDLYTASTNEDGSIKFDGTATCTKYNVAKRNCVDFNNGTGQCSRCKPGYYVTSVAEGQNETDVDQVGVCRRGSDNCNIGCAFCKNSTECNVIEDTNSASTCAMVNVDDATNCFECKAGSTKELFLSDCQEKPAVLPTEVWDDNCGMSMLDNTSGAYKCLECKPAFKAVWRNITTMTIDSVVYPVASFTCEAEDKADEHYLSCLQNSPGKYVTEKWYQVVWEKDISSDSVQQAYWSGIEVSTIYTITDTDLLALTTAGYSVDEIEACRRKTSHASSDFGSYSAACIRLLATRIGIANPVSGQVPISKIWYRGVIRIYRTGVTPCAAPNQDKTCLQYDYDRDFLTSTLMWSQVGVWGPWVHIPHGCPVINAAPLPEAVEEPCEWYHRVGKTIQAAANYARFTGDGFDETTTESKSSITDYSSASGIADIFDFSEEATTANGLSDPMAQCLLEKLVTIHDTADVQCLLKGFEVASNSGWTQGLPSGVDSNTFDVKDCSHMSDMFQHGENCYQVIVMNQAKSVVHPACEDFITGYKRSSLYGECVNKCGEIFRKNFQRFGYNQHLFSNWAIQGQENPENVYSEDQDDNNDEFTRGTVVEGIMKDELHDRGPGSYPYCVLSLYADWDKCYHVDNKPSCNTTCDTQYTDLITAFDLFKTKALENYNSLPSDPNFAWTSEDGDQRFDQIQSYYEQTLSKLQVMRNERDLLLEHVKELGAAKVREEDRRDNNSEDYDSSLLTEVTDQYDKTVIWLDTKRAALKTELINWKDYVTGHIVDSGTTPCAQNAESTDNTTVFQNYVGTDFDTFAAKQNDVNFLYSCGFGSETDASNPLTRQYCGEDLGYCCKTDTTVTVLNSEGVSQTRNAGICWHTATHPNCAWSDTNKDGNLHYKAENLYLCDLRRQQKEHKAVWNYLYDGYEKLQAYKTCTFCQETANAAHADCQ